MHFIEFYEKLQKQKPSWANYAAMDSNGQWNYFENKPRNDYWSKQLDWGIDDEFDCYDRCDKSLQYDYTDWKDSLVDLNESSTTITLLEVKQNNNVIVVEPDTTKTGTNYVIGLTKDICNPILFITTNFTLLEISVKLEDTTSTPYSIPSLLNFADDTKIIMIKDLLSRGNYSSLIIDGINVNDTLIFRLNILYHKFKLKNIIVVNQK